MPSSAQAVTPPLGPEEISVDTATEGPPNKVSPEFLKLQNAVTNIAGIEILEREGDRGPLEGYDL